MNKHSAMGRINLGIACLLLVLIGTSVALATVVVEENTGEDGLAWVSAMPEGSSEYTVIVIDTSSPEAVGRLEAIAAENGGAAWFDAADVAAADGATHTEKITATIAKAGMSPDMQLPVVGFGAGADVAMVLAFESWPVVIAMGADLSVQMPQTNSTSKLLVISEYDPSENVTGLEVQLDEAGVEWETIRLAPDNSMEQEMQMRAMHKMLTFLAVGGVTAGSMNPGMSPAGVEMEIPFMYDDGNTTLEGYLAKPAGLADGDMVPAVVILPDWTGLDSYELERANLLAMGGYVGLAANIYGEAVNYTVPSFQERGAMVGYWRTNWDLYIIRIRAAIDAAKALPFVDSSKIAVIGYCFGGSGAIYEALDMSEMPVVVSFHGGISEPRISMEGERATSAMVPYLSVQSGGSDESPEDIDWLLQSLAAKPGNWDLTRYSQVVHGFTHWGGNGYHERAEGRSWMALMDELLLAFGAPNMPMASNGPMMLPEGATDVSVVIIDTPGPEAMARAQMMAETMGGAMMIPASSVVEASGDSHTEKLMAAAASYGMAMESDVPVVGFGAGADVALVMAFESWPVVVAVGANLSMARPSGAVSSSKLLTISAFAGNAGEATDLEADLDAAGVEWETITLGDSPPMFFNEDSAVMTRAYKKMMTFLDMGGSAPGTTSPGADPEGVTVEVPFLYMDGEAELEAYVAVPEGLPDSDMMTPAVIILPDWDGLNTYEMERANMLAIDGYVGFAANIYGEAANFTIPTVEERRSMVGYWRTNWDLYIIRIRAAIDAVKALPYVDSSKIAVIGYCFGGSGVIYEALDSSEVQVAVSYHGGISEPRIEMEGARATSELMPYLSVQSGGSDESAEDIQWLLESLAAKPGDWDLTRYSQVVHSFTVWGHSGYNARAEGRSWMALLDEMNTTFDGAASLAATSLSDGSETPDGGDSSSSVKAILATAAVLGIAAVQLIV